MSEPIDLISLGAGVQSSTLAFMAAKGEVGPKPQAAIFGDTKAEPQNVYDWLDWMEGQLPFPVIRVTNGSLEDHALKMRTTRDGRSFTVTSLPYFTVKKSDGALGKVPHRTCTADFKIKPIIKEARRRVGKERMTEWRRTHRESLKAIAGYKKRERIAKRLKAEFNEPFPHDAWRECQSDPLVIQWIGISLDEASRMKPSRDPWIVSRWPLIELRMNRNDCLMWMEKNGYPKPPRSACVFCPFHNDTEWRRLRDDDAVAFERAVAVTKGLTENLHSNLFLHRSCVPLDKVDFSTEEDRGQINLFENECEGMCGV